MRVAIDDFGTGCTSLGHLRRLPVDTLKIDRSFVSGLERHEEDRAVVRAVTTLAHDLGMAVTAEGIETAEQFGHLRALGVDHGQGYHLAAPLEGAAVGKLLARGARLPGPLIPDAMRSDGGAATTSTG